MTLGSFPSLGQNACVDCVEGWVWLTVLEAWQSHGSMTFGAASGHYSRTRKQWQSQEQGSQCPLQGCIPDTLPPLSPFSRRFHRHPMIRTWDQTLKTCATGDIQHLNYSNNSLGLPSLCTAMGTSSRTKLLKFSIQFCNFKNCVIWQNPISPVFINNS